MFCVSPHEIVKKCVTPPSYPAQSRYATGYPDVGKCMRCFLFEN